MNLFSFQKNIYLNKDNLSVQKSFLLYILSLSFLALYSFFLIRFVANDGLSSFATDSANYMVMARYLSPWNEASIPIKAAWPNQDFPILFPFILAITGVAYDFFLAHIITALFLMKLI